VTRWHRLGPRAGIALAKGSIAASEGNSKDELDISATVASVELVGVWLVRPRRLLLI
jgi:hypothetical protein